MKRFILGIPLILLLTTWGCSPVVPAPITTDITHSSTATLSPAPTHTSTPQATATPTLTPSPTPGPDIDLLYFSGGEIRCFHMQDWSEEIIPVQSNGEIHYAALSPDKKWFAFKDTEGLKLVEKPFTSSPVLISTRPGLHSEDPGFLFNNSSTLLAYTDDIGLQIYNLTDHTSYQLRKHNIDYEKILEYRSYFASQWSPDDQWLWLNVGSYETGYHALLHLRTNTYHELSLCYTDVDWLPDSQGFLATMGASPIDGCGWNDGVYLITLNNAFSVTETYIHQESEPVEREFRIPDNVQLSPDVSKYVFTKSDTYYFDTYPSYLILLNMDGTGRRILDSSNGEILSPVWSPDGRGIYYIEMQEANSIIKHIDIITKEISILCTVPGHLGFLAHMDNENWLAASYSDYRLAGLIYFIDKSNGEGIRIPDSVDIRMIPLLPTYTPRPTITPSATITPRIPKE